MGTARRRLGLLFLAALMAAAPGTHAGITSAYRRKLEATADMPFDADVFRLPTGYNAPQQVHITLGDQAGTAMTVSWVTASEPGSSTVRYGRGSPDPRKMKLSARGTRTRYSYVNYTSGFIHHCTLTGLKHGAKYYYAMGFGHTVRSFSFTVPPKPGPDVPFKFGLIGMLILLLVLLAVSVLNSQFFGRGLFSEFFRVQTNKRMGPSVGSRTRSRMPREKRKESCPQLCCYDLLHHIQVMTKMMGGACGSS